MTSASQPSASRPATAQVAADIVAVVVSTAVAFELAADTESVLRPLAALLFVLAVPGWCVLRLARAPLSTMTVPVAFCLSVAVSIFVSMVLVAWFDWVWRPTAAVMATACAFVVVYAWVRDGRPAPRTRFDDDD